MTALQPVSGLGARVIHNRLVQRWVWRGTHTGECELADGKLRGIAVHIGSRVASEAAAGEVLETSPVRDLVAGSGLSFADRGDRRLKGLDDPVHLYVLELE